MDKLGALLLSLAVRPEQAELEAQVKSANDSLQEALQAIRQQDAGQLETALQKFHKAYETLQEAAKKPPK